MFNNKEQVKCNLCWSFLKTSFTKPQTMNFAVRTFLCTFLDFSQFTVDSSENKTENNFKKIMFFFLVLHSTFGVYIRHAVA